MGQQITKLEAARRQLVTAIRLFFEDADSVSVYALSHAAWEVLDALCHHRGLTRFREEMSGANGLSEQEIKRIANYGRNFFKHAKQDPDDALDDFSDDRNDHVLLAATFDYGTLAASKPMEVQVFQIWYFATHPNKALRPAMDHILDAGQKFFPNIHTMSRKSKRRRDFASAWRRAVTPISCPIPRPTDRPSARSTSFAALRTTARSSLTKNACPLAGARSPPARGLSAGEGPATAGSENARPRNKEAPTKRKKLRSHAVKQILCFRNLGKTAG